MTEPTIAAPILLVRSGGDAAVPDWQAAFAPVLPNVEVRGWNDPTVDPADVAYALVWEPEPGRLARYKNLRLIFSTAAGVDHIVNDPDLPCGIPVIRMGADEMAQTVGEYACLAALMILRDLPRMVVAQQRAQWQRFEGDRTARETRVGIMGMGVIGKRTTDMLGGIGFPVHGWARTPRSDGGMKVFVGMEELDAFLACTDILINILPDTPQTRGLMDAPRLAMLPVGAGLINVGRGTWLVMEDLIAALDCGQISLAVLDVFATEPLPPDDPAWCHPRILVTPHLAGFASRPSRARSVASGIVQHAAGLPIANRYDAGRGY